MRVAIVLLVLIFAIGCKAIPEAQLNAFIGKPVSNVVDYTGTAPTRSCKMDGMTIYTWEIERPVSSFGKTLFSIYTFYVNEKGIVIRWMKKAQYMKR